MVGNALTVFRNGFLTLKSSALGRLVPDAKNPSQDFWPQKDITLSEDQVDTGEFHELRQAFTSGFNVGLGAKLSRLFSTDVSLESLSKDGLQADKVHRYLLKQPRSHFYGMCADKDARYWMEDIMRDCPLFLISGLITVTEAGVQREQKRDMQASSDIEVPIGAALTGGALAAVDQAGVTDVGVNAHGGRLSGESISFIAPGERVVGVQYRKVKFKAFSEKSIDNATLERSPNRWKMFFGGDRAGEKDMIEADLQDDLTEGDLEIDDEEGLAIWDTDKQHQN
jgi:hypothetical protein